MERPSALIIAGDGINCETETADAFRIAGFSSKIIHLNDLIAQRVGMDELSRNYAALAIPGGFSFGDDLVSGKILALKIKNGLKWDLASYAERGGLVLGVCNGFQALIRMGVFGRDLSISQNSGGKFINNWVRVAPQGSKCVWLTGIGTIDLPVRHAEGKITLRSSNRKEVIAKMTRQEMNCLTYEEKNPNGSEESIAGLCDSTGRIFGLMPHPEAFVRWTSHPEWTVQPSRAGGPGAGLHIFENAYREARGAS